jgi:flagellar export protein FliJ
MKRFQFRLERVLWLKEQRERLVEMQQQQARARCEEARAACAHIEAELVRTAAHAMERMREAATLGTWRSHYEQAARLGELLAAAQRRLGEAEKLLQEANRLRIQAALEVETLRNLRSKEWQNYRKEAARRQHNKLDELGLQRWLAARDQGPFGCSDTAQGKGA